MLPGILASLAYLGMPVAQVEFILMIVVNINMELIVMMKVSFAGASLVTSFFLARRGKAFLQPGQDIEIAVMMMMMMIIIILIMLIIIIIMMMIMIIITMRNEMMTGIDRNLISSGRCWPFNWRNVTFQFGEVLANLLASTELLSDQAEVF